MPEDAPVISASGRDRELDISSYPDRLRFETKSATAPSCWQARVAAACYEVCREIPKSSRPAGVDVNRTLQIAAPDFAIGGIVAIRLGDTAACLALTAPASPLCAVVHPLVRLDAGWIAALRGVIRLGCRDRLEQPGGGQREVALQRLVRSAS
jgi:hypothetical protein